LRRSHAGRYRVDRLAAAPQSDPVFRLPQIDFPQIVLLHQLDETANAVDVEHVVRTGFQV
jgi:hypothetical protein